MNTGIWMIYLWTTIISCLSYHPLWRNLRQVITQYQLDQHCFVDIHIWNIDSQIVSINMIKTKNDAWRSVIYVNTITELIPVASVYL